MILLQNQKLCLRLPGQEVVHHHPQSSTTSVLPPREKEVGQNPQLNRRLWLGLRLVREVDLDLLKNLMGNQVHPLKKEVNQTLLQILKLRHEYRLEKGVDLGHLQRSRANPDLLLGAVDLAHLLKLKISQEQHPGHRVVLIPLLNPRLLPFGLFPDKAGQVHQAKAEALLLKEAVVQSRLQNTHPNPELLEEALGPHQSPRPSPVLHLAVAALDPLLSSLGRPDSLEEAALHPHHQKPVLELPQDAEEVLQSLPQSQLKSRDPHAAGAQLHPHVQRQLQGEAVLLHQSPVGSRGPVPAQGGRKPEQLDVEIGLDLLSQPLGEDSVAGQGLGSLVGGEEALVTTRGLPPGRRVPELLPDAEEAVHGHPRPVGSGPAHVPHQPHGNVQGLGPLPPLTGDPGPEHLWSAAVGPGLEPHQSVGDDQGPGHQ